MPSARVLICEIRPADEYPELADAGVPGVADQGREVRRPLLGEIAVVRLGTEAEVEARTIERLAGVEIDRAGETALDHLGGRVLADDHRPEQFRRNVGEVERLAANAGRKRGAPVEFGADEVETAHDYARTLDREVIGVVRAGESIDRDARNALQRLGHRPVRKRADVFSGDRVDYRICVALDILRLHQRLADAGNDNHIIAHIRRLRALVCFARSFGFGGLRRILSSGHLAGQKHAECAGRRPAPQQRAQVAHIARVRNDLHVSCLRHPVSSHVSATIPERGAFLGACEPQLSARS